ncbi:MAG: hypothetical protein IOD12_09465 [Silvanigrellales bacterium]|nr:hypothetical protein [Silvanigrellales bacterium]
MDSVRCRFARERRESVRYGDAPAIPTVSFDCGRMKESPAAKERVKASLISKGFKSGGASDYCQPSSFDRWLECPLFEAENSPSAGTDNILLSLTAGAAEVERAVRALRVEASPEVLAPRSLIRVGDAVPVLTAGLGGERVLGTMVWREGPLAFQRTGDRSTLSRLHSLESRRCVVPFTTLAILGGAGKWTVRWSPGGFVGFLAATWARVSELSCALVLSCPEREGKGSESPSPVTLSDSDLIPWLDRRFRDEEALWALVRQASVRPVHMFETKDMAAVNVCKSAHHGTDAPAP